jgi:thioredoxin reductase (NADPH)
MSEYTLQNAAFPILSENQISQLTECAPVVPRHCTDGETLIAVMDRTMKFYIVKSGQIEIVDSSGDAPKTIAVHGKGQFTGDISHLTGAASMFSAIARGDCEVLEITSQELRHVLNQSPALGDIILQAFIARRQLVRESPNFKGMRVIGSRYSPDTFRVRDFLARNRVLFTWVDIESDPEVDQLLKEFHITEADTPVVVCAQMLMLRNPPVVGAHCLRSTGSGCRSGRACRRGLWRV